MVRIKLHKQPSVSLSEFSSQSLSLADKYLGRLGAQIPFSASRGGRYPPSRDGQFQIQVEQEEFNEALGKGGHHLPLTS